MTRLNVIIGLLIPFLGTSLGVACVLFMKEKMGALTECILQSFAAGVMVAASVWSLLIPSMEMAEHMGKLAFVPAAVGFALGILFLLCIDRLVPHLHTLGSKPEGTKIGFSKTTMLVLAVTIHNIPEGMAVGVVFAGFLAGTGDITLAAAFALAIGIAIQNFPEGAIVSMPLRAEGNSKSKSFFYGVLSGAVEPVAAFFTILLSSFIQPVLPYLLSFAAGAMMYVVVEELIPEAEQSEKSDWAVIGFSVGFLIMMILDVALG